MDDLSQAQSALEEAQHAVAAGQLLAAQEHERARRALWAGVATAVATGGTAGSGSPAIWADTVLRAYDFHFPNPIFPWKKS